MKYRDLFFISSLFYIGWFASVFLAKTSFSIISLVFPAVLIAFLVSIKNLNVKNTFLALAITIAGVVFDFFMIKFEFIRIQGEILVLIPTWLVAIWLLFAFSMIKLGTMLNPPLWLSIAAGALMGPISYKSGEIFQVLEFSSAGTFVIYAIFWGFTFPIILKLSKRYI